MQGMSAGNNLLLAEMMTMPTPFDGYVEKPVRVSSACLVSIVRNRYSMPCELVGQWVSGSAVGSTRPASR